MAVVLDKNGKKIVLLNPAEKGQKYARELSKRCDQHGEALSEGRAGFRIGYLAAREDSARAFCHKEGRKYQKGKFGGAKKNRHSKKSFFNK